MFPVRLKPDRKPEGFRITGSMTIAEQYRALKEQAVTGSVAPGAAIGVRGNDRKGYLHGLLTNDIQGLTPGKGCYAAWLTPQGRMLTDMHVFERDDMMLVDVPAGLAPVILQRLDRSLFSEDVQFSDLSHTLASVWVHGPATPELIQRILPVASPLESWADYQNERIESVGSPIVVVRVNQLGVPGFGIYVQFPQKADMQRTLEAAGALPVDPAVLEIARIEAGYPLFGVDMTDDTIPLEAGIEDRAISFTKGCYVGQEVIIRVLHRGHGRVVRKLVGLRVDGDVPSHGAKIVADGREVGWVTSAASSPRLGPIALGYVHRDFVSPGVRVEIDAPSGRIGAVVSDRPISPEAR
jgi:tRNA-modifying protein YgfZ